MTPRYRVVTLADSLALPRDLGGDRILWEETWPYLLHERLHARDPGCEVVNCATRERTVDMLISEFSEHVRYKRPAAAVIQVGVVDCAPRVFSKRAQMFLRTGLVPAPLRNWLVRYRSARRAAITARDPLARAWTSPKNFERYLDRFGGMVRELDWRVDLFVVPILADLDAMERKSPGYRGNVSLYNDLLRRFCRAHGALWIEVAGAGDPALYFGDGYHLSPLGHVRLAEALAAPLLRAAGARP